MVTGRICARRSTPAANQPDDREAASQQHMASVKAQRAQCDQDERVEKRRPLEIERGRGVDIGA